jgi:hypothetical protein
MSKDGKHVEVYMDYPESDVVRPYIKKQEGKTEIHDYGSGLKFISNDKHGCNMEEVWVPTYRKKNGTIVHGHCRSMNNDKPLTKDEIHALYDPKEWDEIERNERRNRKKYMQKRRSLR